MNRAGTTSTTASQGAAGACAGERLAGDLDRQHSYGFAEVLDGCAIAVWDALKRQHNPIADRVPRRCISEATITPPCWWPRRGTAGSAYSYASASGR